MGLVVVGPSVQAVVHVAGAGVGSPVVKLSETLHADRTKLANRMKASKAEVLVRDMVFSLLKLLMGRLFTFFGSPNYMGSTLVTIMTKVEPMHG